MNRIILLIIMLLFNLSNAAAQADRQALAAKDTRIMYDARGHGINAAYDFVILNHKKHPVIIGVATDDEKFIEAVKQIIREMDSQGYENIALLLHDKRDGTQVDKETHSITFYKNGDIDGRIAKQKGEWNLVIVGKEQKLSSTMMAKEKSDYPLLVIRTKIRTTHDGSGANNYVTNIQN